MQNSSKRFTITAALPYTNGPVHIGHLAGVYVPADIYSRFQRLQGNDVALFVVAMSTEFLLQSRQKRKALHHNKW